MTDSTTPTPRLVFQNPGVIPLTAITTLGINAKTEGAIGFFGTGLKYAIATILRLQGSITIFRGEQQLDFYAMPEVVRDKTFQIVCMSIDGTIPVNLGFTTDLGKTWEPWQAYRELESNVRDENGSSFTLAADEATGLDADSTTIIVQSEHLYKAWQNRAQYFLTNEPRWTIANLISVGDNMTKHLYYRGIKVNEMERHSLFTYNLLGVHDLTEDRTIKHFWQATGAIRLFWEQQDDYDLFLRMLTCGTVYLEYHLAFNEYWTPPKSFVDAVLDAQGSKELREKLNPSALRLVNKALRKRDEERSYSRAARKDNLTIALDILADQKLPWDEEQFPIICTAHLDQVPGQTRHCQVDNGRFYILEEAISNLPIRDLTLMVTASLLELMHPYSDEGRLTAAITALVDSNWRMRRAQGEQVIALGDDLPDLPSPTTPV